LNKASDNILIIDFGSQYTQLIARRIREIGVFSMIEPNNLSLAKLREINPKGIILSGGPESVNQASKLKLPNYFYDAGIPILGICYGMQLIADKFGGKITSSKQKEFGLSYFSRTNKSKLFEGNKIPEKFKVWMSHSDRVTRSPKGFQTIGNSTNSSISAFSNEKLKIYGLQFHPEVTHTTYGKDILKNFCKKICKCNRKY